MTLASHLRSSLLAALVTAALSVSAAAAPSVLKYAPSAEPRTMDPVVSTLAIAQQHGYLVYDTLFSLDAALKPQPQMVGKWEVSPDGKVYTMTLRDGLKFHDGSPVRTADVIASIDRWAQRDTVGLRLVALGMKLAAVDDKTFTVSLDKPTDLVLSGFAKLSSAALFIMREQEAKTPPSQAVTKVVGSGPFRFVESEYRPGAKIVYEKFKDYVPRPEAPSYFAGGKVAKIDRIEWDIMPDPGTAVSALLAGEIQVYEAPPQDLLPVLKAQNDIVVRPLGNLGQFGFLRPNTLQPPFDTVAGRKAVALLINQSEVMAAAVGADPQNWSVCYSFFSCGGSNETQAGTDWMRKRDVAQAKELLKQAGYKGERVVLLAPGDNAILKSFAEVAGARLRDGGLNIDIQYSDFSTLLARRANRGTPAEGGWNLFPMWTFTFESDNPLLGAYFNAACNDRAYAGWYCSQEIENLKQNWVLAQSPEQKKADIARIQAVMAQDMPIIPLGKFTSPIAYSKRVKGFLDTPIPVFWNVEITN